MVIGPISYTLEHLKSLCCQMNIHDCQGQIRDSPTHHLHESSEVELFYKRVDHGIEKRSSQFPVREIIQSFSDGEGDRRKLLFIDVGFRQCQHSLQHPSNLRGKLTVTWPYEETWRLCLPGLVADLT